MLEFAFCSFVLLFFIGLANENKRLSQDRIFDYRLPIGPMLAQRNVFSTWACDHGVSLANVGFCRTYIPTFLDQRKIVEVILQSPLSCATTYALFLPNNRISENRNVIEVTRIGPFQADSRSLIGYGSPWKNYFQLRFFAVPLQIKGRLQRIGHCCWLHMLFQLESVSEKRYKWSLSCETIFRYIPPYRLLKPIEPITRLRKTIQPIRWSWSVVQRFYA